MRNYFQNMSHNNGLEDGLLLVGPILEKFVKGSSIDIPTGLSLNSIC